MNFWTAAVLIVLICGVVTIFTARRGRHSGSQENGETLQQPDEATEREVAELRERIRVLERIATDENTTEARKIREISDEIESLREK